MNVGPYRLLVHQGPGQPGDWYHALDERDNQPVRVHVVWRPDEVREAWAALARRLRLAGQFTHDAAILPVHVELESPHPYAVWPMPAQPPLAIALRQRDAWSEAEVLQIGLELTAALTEAHRLGLVHECIGPSEIFLDGDKARLDFAGAAHAADAGATIVAPARLHDRPADPATDIFDLGAVLYRMLHGRPAPAAFERSFLGESVDVKATSSLIELMLAADPDLRPSARECHVALSILNEELSQHRRTLFQPSQEEAPPTATLVSDQPAGGVHSIGRYRVIRKLGEGGLGAVYLASDSSDGSQVALKVLHRRFADSARVVRRFRKEARLLASIDSPYVCRLLEFNEDRGHHFLAMEYLDGQSVGKLLERHRLIPERLTLHIIADAARALAEAHRRGIVHRDVKPDNIMLVGPWSRLADAIESGDAPLEPGGGIRVKLCDFGMARQVEQTASMEMTLAGLAMGTPLYMAPEQANGELDVTPSADVYSLGVTLYHLLAGRPPFQAKTVPALIQMHITEDPPPPQSFNPAVGSAASQVALKAMAKAPEARYASAEDMLRDLELLLRGEPTGMVVHPRLPPFTDAELIAYDWSWDLAAAPAQLWPLVSNTERLNQAVGIPAVHFTLQKSPQREGDGLRPRVDRYGAFKKAGIANTWREHAYEWVEGKRMCVLREYTEGLFRWFVSIVELQARASGGTTLHHHVRLVPRGRFGRIVAALEVGYRGRRAVEAVYRRIDAYLTQQLPASPASDPFVPRARGAIVGRRLLQGFVDRLTRRGVEGLLAESLVEFFLQAPEQEIARIRPIALAHRLNLDPDAVVDACLIAAHEGILVLAWDILCPKCRIAASIEETMSAIRSHGHCQACDLDFQLDFANSVEMIFRIHPGVRPAETGVFCIGGPSHSPHCVAQLRVAPGERLELNLSLGEGSYCIRGPQLAYQVDFRVHSEGAAVRGELMLKQGPGAEFPPVFRSGAQTLLLTNEHSDELVVRIERAAPRTDAVTAARASGLSRFRELFPQEVLAGNQLVSVAQVTLLTTALDEPSRLYERGDTRAFAVLHEYFRLLEDFLRKEGGTLVKTVQEGVLAVFQDSAAAVRVALDLGGLLAKHPATADLTLRVGVHAGPAMVATLNGKLDYFGGAVNLAMTLPAHGEPGDVIITHPLTTDPRVQRLLQSRQLACEVLPTSPAGTPLSRVKKSPV